MLWVKAFHVIFVVTWFAGLFYLPRLFVYHASCDDATGERRFKVMERRLLGITTIGGAAALVFGVSLLVWWSGALTGEAAWLRLKLVLVLGLVGYHAWCWRTVRSFDRGENRRGERYYRWMNEVPAVLLIAIVVLVVVKPF